MEGIGIHHWFIENLLPNIVFHRKQLRLLHKNTRKFSMDLFNCVYMDVGFLEKLTNDIKWESQSLYWSEKQVTVDSGKKNGKGNQMKRKHSILVFLTQEIYLYMLPLKGCCTLLKPVMQQQYWLKVCWKFSKS